MKRLMTLGVAILLLAGCSSTSSYTTKVTDGDIKIASVGNATITKQDLYEHLMDTNGVDYILNQALTHIAETFEVDEEALNAEVASTENTWKGILGDNLDSYTKSAFGYDTFEEYKTEILIPSVRQILMIEQYAIDNYDTLASKNMFVKARQIIVDDQSTAIKVISALSAKETTFEEALETYSTDSTNKTNKGEMGLISDLSSCQADENIEFILPQLKITGVYSSPVELSTGKYAILEIQETDTSKMKDEVLAQLKEAEEVIYEAEDYYLSQNNFTIVDKYLNSQMQSRYPEYVD